MEKASVVHSRSLYAWFKYGTVFAILWTLLTQGEFSSWLIGIVLVPIATWCAIYLFPSRVEKGTDNDYALHPLALLRFTPFFIAQSLKGGWESASFAISLRKQVRSGFIHYKSSLPAGRPRLFFVNTISILPGTVSAAIDGDKLSIHALDIQANNTSALLECENQIAKLFGLGPRSLTRCDEENSQGETL